MTPAAHIALRFTVSRKRSLALSLVGVIFGVAFFILTQAQTQGFEQYFIETILGTSGAVVITDRFQSRYTSFAAGKYQRGCGRNSTGGTEGSIVRDSGGANRVGCHP